MTVVSKKTWPVVIWPAEVLSEPAKPVDFDEPGKRNLKFLAEEMEYAMLETEGVGIAAPQIGISLQVALVRLNHKAPPNEQKLIVLVNPVLLMLSKETKFVKEGCLSLPGEGIRLLRHERVIVRWNDVRGHTQEQEFEGFEAQQIQHEVDHLRGTMIVDHAGGVARSMARVKMLKLKKSQQKMSEGESR